MATAGCCQSCSMLCCVLLLVLGVGWEGESACAAWVMSIINGWDQKIAGTCAHMMRGLGTFCHFDCMWYFRSMGGRVRVVY